MRARAAVVVLALVALALGAERASADHGEPSTSHGHWHSSLRHSLVFEDRTGNAYVWAGVQEAAKRWTEASAGHLTIKARQGPTGSCTSSVPAGTVPVCWSGGGWYATRYQDSSGHLRSAEAYLERGHTYYVWAAIHETGHALGLGHSCEFSVMNVNLRPGSFQPCSPPWGGGQAGYPSRHDTAALVKLYGHSDTTTTTRAWCSSYPQWC